MDTKPRSESPDRKISTLIKHALRKKTPHNSPSASLHSNEEHEKGGLFDKLKEHAHRPHRKSTDGERRGSFDPGRRLSKLVPSISKPKSKKGERNDDDDVAGDDGGASLKGSRSGDGASEHKFGLHSESTDSLALDSRADSISSSLLTDDEDISPSTRPSLDTRPSHAGYLTLSSPLFTAESIETADSAPPSTTSILSDVPPSSHPINPSTDTTSGDFVRKIPPSPPERASTKGDSPISRRPLQNIATAIPPSTLVTPPTPDLSRSPSPFTPPRRPIANSTVGPAPPQSALSSAPVLLSDKQARSATTFSSKLVNPLTLANEGAKTPGSSLVQPGSPSFFTSVISATQNAVNQISNSLSSGVPSVKSRSLVESERAGPTGGEEVIESNNKHPAVDGASPILSEPAIATLGSGNLSLSQLGISETHAEDSLMTSNSNATGRNHRSPSIAQHGHLPNKEEEASAAGAVTAAYTDTKPLRERERAMSIINDPLVTSGRPRSIASAIGSVPGDVTPPPAGTNGAESNVSRRSNSMRSRLSDRRKRHRSSSVAQGGAIAAALGASHAALANPAGKGRPTGFALASSKRNKDFHQLFKSVPEDDFLVEDCGAALQRDILLQGRLYISEKHICFSSNILGWVTNLVMSFEEIVAMEKKITALVFPNAIMIQTLHSKNTFASLIGRDATYDLLIGIWRMTHPNLKATEFGHTINTDAIEDQHATNHSSEDSEESAEYYDDDEDDDDEAGSFVEAPPSEIGSESVDPARISTAKLAPAPGGTAAARASSKSPDAQDAHMPGAISGDFPGPMTHAPTECSDGDFHYEKQLMDTAIPAPLGKVYTMMFGPQSGTVMRRFLLDDQKSGDLQMEDDKRGLGDEQKTNSYSFIKPLNASIGPKQTKCIVTQTLDAFDLEKAVSVTCSTATPDVPNGNLFLTKTKYCLMWAPNNSTRLIMNCTVEWSGKSWIRGPIEKGANEGQEKYGRDIVAFFKAQVATKSPSKSLSKNGKTKSGRRKKSSAEGGSDSTAVDEKSSSTSSSRQSSWGMLEPLHPIADILGPLMSNPTAILGALLFLTTILWLRSAYFAKATVGGTRGRGLNLQVTPHRLAAYEELWRAEESDLWSWLEDRSGLNALDTIVTPLSAGSDEGNENLKQARRDVRSQEERMTQRQIDEAIRVTQEKLNALKKKRGEGGV